jgi:glycosyltransferase involved in cell wall biosynthesis
MKVLFASYSAPDSNSGIHIFNLANHLVEAGVEAVVAVPAHKERVETLGAARFRTLQFDELLEPGSIQSFDLIHAWTPRRNVQHFVERLLRRQETPYIVHLEDNEDAVLTMRAGLLAPVARRLPAPVLDLLLRPTMSNPRRYPDFLRGASGLTMVIDALRGFCPPGIPRHLLWAGFEDALPWDRSPDRSLRGALHLAEDELIIAYTGNVHAGNWADVSDLYHAVDLLARRGVRIRLLRTGTNHLRAFPWRAAGLRSQYAIELGRLPRAQLPSVLSIADVLVQPGRPGSFNDFRFPSKLPEFLASGKPVILPRTNIGLHLKNEQECLLLERAGPVDIADKVQHLLEDPGLRARIGAGGRRFAHERLRWSRLAKGLIQFHRSVAASAG